MKLEKNDTMNLDREDLKKLKNFINQARDCNVRFEKETIIFINRFYSVLSFSIDNEYDNEKN